MNAMSPNLMQENNDDLLNQWTKNTRQSILENDETIEKILDYGNKPAYEINPDLDAQNDYFMMLDEFMKYMKNEKKDENEEIQYLKKILNLLMLSGFNKNYCLSFSVNSSNSSLDYELMSSQTNMQNQNQNQTIQYNLAFLFLNYENQTEQEKNQINVQSLEGQIYEINIQINENGNSPKETEKQIYEIFAQTNEKVNSLSQEEVEKQIYEIITQTNKREKPETIYQQNKNIEDKIYETVIEPTEAIPKNKEYPAISSKREKEVKPANSYPKERKNNPFVKKEESKQINYNQKTKNNYFPTFKKKEQPFQKKKQPQYVEAKQNYNPLQNKETNYVKPNNSYTPKIEKKREKKNQDYHNKQLSPKKIAKESKIKQQPQITRITQNNYGARTQPSYVNNSRMPTNYSSQRSAYSPQKSANLNSYSRMKPKYSGTNSFMPKARTGFSGSAKVAGKGTAKAAGK